MIGQAVRPVRIVAFVVDDYVNSPLAAQWWLEAGGPPDESAPHEPEVPAEFAQTIIV